MVFEVSDGCGPFDTFSIPPEQQGIFFVRSDGTGLRRIGPSSDICSHAFPSGFEISSIGPPRFLLDLFSDLAFSPSGRLVAFTDDPSGMHTPQIVAVDIETGIRNVVSTPPTSDADTPVPGSLFFLDEDTVIFLTFSDSTKGQPGANVFSVKVHGNPFPTRVTRSVSLPETDTLASPGVPAFQIIGRRPSTLTLNLRGPPKNPLLLTPGIPGFSAIAEVFALVGRYPLQLTNFQRIDTAAEFVSPNGQRVFFVSSEDPLGTNPSQNCQLFSISALGADLQQITHFSEGDVALNGCSPGAPPGCLVGPAVQDPATGLIVFYSSCDPFGSNPNGGQLFAVQPDGSGLRQLTRSHGFVRESRTMSAELIGPFAYAGARLSGQRTNFLQ